MGSKSAAAVTDLTDKLMDELLKVGQIGFSLPERVSAAEIGELCAAARSTLLSQPSLLELEPPISICGDIHGQYADLIRVFTRCGFPPATNYLFLGDYVDRGRQNLETICLLLVYKVKYPQHVFLLRGNHECRSINRVYGFLAECRSRYDVNLWHTFQTVFDCLPFCALVADRVFCMHGGLSPDLKSFDQIREMERPMDPPVPSMFIDLLWSDPDKWANEYESNTRGVSYIFSQSVVTKFVKDMKLDMIARAHQVVQDGYEFFARRRLVTLFSAPHYCGEFDNAAAVMTMDKNLLCSFIVLQPVVQPGTGSNNNPRKRAATPFHKTSAHSRH